MAPTWDVPVLLELDKEYDEKQSKKEHVNSHSYVVSMNTGHVLVL